MEKKTPHCQSSSMNQSRNRRKNQNEIMEIEVDYYKQLYISTNPDNEKLKKYIENTKVRLFGVL
jgi:hypothetical protein